jgi:hypothetical protein
MAIAKLVGAQRDFSSGELDSSIKRSDDSAKMKSGARQLSNWRILNSHSITNRPGRTALFPEQGRVEQATLKPGFSFFIAFGAGYLRIYNAAGTQVFNTTLKGDGTTAIPWTLPTVSKIVWSIYKFTIYITYGDDAPTNIPQLLTWDGVSSTSTWTLSTFAFQALLNGGIDAPFYRLAPKGVSMLPSALTGTITLNTSAPYFVSGMVNNHIVRYQNSQIKITAVANSMQATGLVLQTLPMAVSIAPSVGTQNGAFYVGEIVVNSKGYQAQVTAVSGGGITVSFLSQFTFITSDIVVGPHGSMQAGTITAAGIADSLIWDEQIFDSYLGWPQATFFDQNRLGFCNIPSLPSGISYSALSIFNSFFPTALPNGPIFALVPFGAQVFYVVPGMESSEFVFCDKAIYYIPITATVPLTPNNITFNALSRTGCHPGVEPRLAGQVIIYMKPGSVSVGAVQAPGAYYRPYIVDDVSEIHSHLFAQPAVAIAIPGASAQFEELYVYIALADGSIVTGKYFVRAGLLEAAAEGGPKIGWAPWSGAFTVSYVAASNTEVFFTTSYAPNGIPAVNIVERLDSTQYLDAAIPVANVPVPFVTAGKGPLYAFANGSVTLIDLGTRAMGTYFIDANGNIIPQNLGGENLSSNQLVAGQPWTATLEPFSPLAPPGNDAMQRLRRRRTSWLVVYVSNSTGFLFARLFSGPVTRTSPAPGTIMNSFRVETWNQDDDPTQAPPLREQAYWWRPIGKDYDPRRGFIKDTPGPLLIHEVAMEISV